MTREKAIRYLLNIALYSDLGSDYRKALDMAIKALQQIPDLKEAYNKGYKDGQEALMFHIELCKEYGTCGRNICINNEYNGIGCDECGCYQLKSKKEIKHAENNKS